MPTTGSCQGVASRHHGADSLTPRFLPPFEWRSRTLRQIKTGSTHFPKLGRRLLFTIVEILLRISSSRFPYVNWMMLFLNYCLMDLNILLEMEDFPCDWEFLLKMFYRIFWENSIFLDYLCVFSFFQLDKVIAGIFGSEGSKILLFHILGFHIISLERNIININIIKYSFNFNLISYNSIFRIDRRDFVFFIFLFTRNVQSIIGIRRLCKLFL